MMKKIAQLNFVDSAVEVAAAAEVVGVAAEVVRVDVVCPLVLFLFVDAKL